jgi:hypothetical protein
LVGQEGVEEKEPSDDQASPACGLRPEEIPPATLMRAELGGWVIPVYGRRDLSPRIWVASRGFGKCVEEQSLSAT